MTKGILVFLALLVTWAPSAAAQQTPADIISFLVTNQNVRTGDFEKDQAAAAATRDTIARALLVNLASVPIPTSSSGFVYRLDPELGTMSRVSDSFGTFFVERASTSGRGRVSFGASGSTAAYDRLDGLDLTDGTLITTANSFRDEAAPFDTESLTLKMRTSTLTLYGSVGVTDHLEIGGAIPFVRLHLEGTRVNVYRGEQFVQASGTADASGVADAAVRAKYTIVTAPGGGFAIAGEMRLPTGAQENLLGAGRAGWRVVFIGSAEHAHVGVHGNAAIAWRGVSDEADLRGAITAALSPRVTATGELLWRRLSDLHEMVPVSAPHPTIAGVDTMRLLPGPDATTLSTFVSGIKWNVGSTMVLTGQVQWRLGNGGLTAPITPTVALDYLF
ncbi:MAG TPA: hypothetical protein VH458_00455 [Vicinamibacterales bacterium]|jgi:hypothetical protein